MRACIIKTLLYSDLAEVKSKKAFVFYVLRMILCVGGIVYFIEQSNLLHDVSISFYFSAIALGTFIYATLFILSSFWYNRKVTLFHILPIRKIEIFTYISLDLLIEIFITKFLPLLIGISGVLIFNGKITIYECVAGIIKGLSIFIVFSALALMTVMYFAISMKYMMVLAGIIFAILFIKISLFERSIVVDYGIALIMCIISYLIFSRHIEDATIKRKYDADVSGGLLQREFKMFFADKILVCNFLMSSVISLILVINLIINDIHLNFMVAIMTLLPLFSVTTFSVYSYERERTKLLNSLPLRKITIFFNKYIVSLSITLLSVIIISVVLLSGEVVKCDFVVLYVVTTVFICAEKILLDMLEPFLEFSHTEELLRNSRKYKMYVVGTIGYIPVLLLDTGVGLGYLCLFSISLNSIIIGIIYLRIRQNNLK